jgi:Xaa-Pro aminopeptidase
MFQNFESPQAGADHGERIERLRAHMGRAGVDAILVPRADEHQGENVAPNAERLLWLTGFSGSAGLAVIARKSAALFVDGRYSLQARAQVDTRCYQILEVPAAKPADWLRSELKSGAVIGFDPWLHTAGVMEDLAKGLEPSGMRLRSLPKNPVDGVWGRARPPAPCRPVVVHALKYAGRAASHKLEDIQATLRADGHDAVILTLPESICWLFNIRGSDVAHTPVALAFAILPARGKAELFIATAKIGAEARAHLAPLAKISEPAALAARVTALKAAGRCVRLDPATAAAWFFGKLKGGKGGGKEGGKGRVARAPDPCLLPKACKNAIEIKGARAAHQRDGVAVVRYLAWLAGAAPKGGIDEIAAVQRLEALRGETQALQEISFDTISGAGANGAIVHYRVTTTSNRKLQPGELFLVDSGAQYLDGTTDITRTIAIGKPTREMQERFTLVLKGHIALATARFPKGTRGVDLEPFARRALWCAGLDFDHGTGHGVGSYLGVHEGPQSISKRGMVALEAGMIVSNEPGYYKPGAYGIRIENLLLVRDAEALAGGEREMMSFETLTLAPIDRNLIVAGMLSPQELDWLDGYHARVHAAIAAELNASERSWLDAATAPMHR